MYKDNVHICEVAVRQLFVFFNVIYNDISK